MAQVELNNMYVNICANSGSEKLWTKNTATSGKLIKAVYAAYGYVYICCTSQSGQLEYNSVFVGLGEWGERGQWAKHLSVRRWMRTGMGWMFSELCRWEVGVGLGWLPMTLTFLISLIRKMSYIISKHPVPRNNRQIVTHGLSCCIATVSLACYVNALLTGVAPQWQFQNRAPWNIASLHACRSYCTHTRGVDKSLALPGRKQANVSVRMAWISFGALPCREKKNLITARVSRLLKSRASLTCFRACFRPGRAKDLSAPQYVSLRKASFFEGVT